MGWGDGLWSEVLDVEVDVKKSCRGLNVSLASQEGIMISLVILEKV